MKAILKRSPVAGDYAYYDKLKGMTGLSPVPYDYKNVHRSRPKLDNFPIIEDMQKYASLAGLLGVVSTTAGELTQRLHLVNLGVSSASPAVTDAGVSSMPPVTQGRKNSEAPSSLKEYNVAEDEQMKRVNMKNIQKTIAFMAVFTLSTLILATSQAIEGEIKKTPNSHSLSSNHGMSILTLSYQ